MRKLNFTSDSSPPSGTVYFLPTHKAITKNAQSQIHIHLSSKKITYMKKLLLIITLITLSITSQAQTNVDSMNWQLRALFSNLAKPTPPKLFNWDMAVHTVDSSVFIHQNYVDTLTLDNWYNMYAEMRSCAYDTIPIKLADSVLLPCYNYGADTINMMTMFYDFYRFKEEAMTTDLYFNFDTVNNILTDKTVRPGYPYDEGKVFASSPHKNISAKNLLMFRFGLDNLFYDNFNLLDGSIPNRTIRVNFNEGSGWHYLSLGAINFVPIHFDTAGKYTIEMEVVDIVGEEQDVVNIIAHSNSYLRIKKTRQGVLDNPDQQHSMFGMNINQYEPCNNVGDRAKTLIYVEGIDIGDFKNELRNADDIYWGQIREPGISDLRNYGYRIFVISWQNSRKDMRDNAKNLNDFIEYLKCGNLIGDKASDEEFVIMAESMGGIIANYALMQFEQGQYNSICKPRKMHNTRLLITLDAPFAGAHIPMGLQKMAEFLSYNFSGASGIPYLPQAAKLYLKNQNLFHDGDAAKQLLISHIQTQSPLGPFTYTPHNKRNSFIADQNALGKHPKYCKLICASNGNMLANGQNRLWDGLDRVDGDDMLATEYSVYGTILKQKIPLAGVDLAIHTDPNGTGEIARLTFGTWTVKFKLKWFGLKVTKGYNSVCNKIWDADMLPISNRAGGNLDYNEEVNDIFLANKTYNQNGNWSTMGTTKWGMDIAARSDGFHWNFVPVTSAFDYGINVSPFDNMNINTVFNLLPFDVFYGVPGNTQNNPPSTDPNIFRFTNIHIRNNDHLDVRNDSLRDNVNFPLPNNWISYNPCPFIPVVGGGTRPHIVRMLNREMGDDEIYLENRYQKWDANLSINNRIHVNVKSNYYKYPNFPAHPNCLPSIYSREKPYIIDNQALESFWTNNPNSVNYQPPLSGPYTNSIYTITPCCNNFLKEANPKGNNDNKQKKEIVIYPNPTTQDFTIRFIPNSVGVANIKVLDLLGKVVFEQTEQVSEKNNPVSVYVQLPNALPLGQYILRTTLNEQLFSNKLILQQ